MEAFLQRHPRRTTALAVVAVLLAAAAAVQAVPGWAAVCEGPPVPSQSASPSPSASVPAPSPSSGGGSGSPAPSPSLSLPGVPTLSSRAGAARAQGASTNNDQDPTACGAAMTLHGVPSSGVVGTTFLMTGTLSCNGNLLGGKPVELQKLSNGAWVSAGSSETADQEATYAFTQKPSVNTAYRAIFAGDALCDAATSAVQQIVVRPGVSMNVAGTSTGRGGTAVFSGGVGPSHAGHGVILQVLQGGAWRNATSARLDSGSRYRLTYTRKSGSGPLLFRVAYPTQHADHGWNISRAVRVTWA